jgi:ATP-dependent exoDNAse (exonuclease V) beta subunit
MQRTTPLIIYKASAGSGKTFTLATEYIKLVVRNPQAYKQILAVTFTNKATEEMKMRILSQLYGIWRNLPSSKAYSDVICRELDASPEFVARQAGVALGNLLHNYSYFRIDTIDSFFQSILRNLARELDLTANLTIGLNDRQVEELAVDEVIENLSATDQMLQWILKYIMENISDDRSWNIIGQLKLFGRTIFKDFYKKESKMLYKKMRTPGFIDDYTAMLRKTRDDAKKRMKAIGDEFIKELEGAGFTVNDLSYSTSGVAGLFIKLRNGIFDESVFGTRVSNCIDNPDAWCKKTHPRRMEIQALANGKLGGLLRQAAEERPLQWKLYKSADLTLLHLNQLRLLESIESKVRELNESANRFLLSDTQQLLHDLIEGSDSPFIFEKIGTQLEHIMIDEFQDTSTVQWQNFKVLLEETMSHAHSENLIVGDVKQSIYRWRSGDWRLLGNIEQEFENAEERLAFKNLDTNFRSSRYVVGFNNAFFRKAAELEEVNAYNDVEQKVPRQKADDGYVNVRLLPSEDYQENVLETLLTQISHLIDSNIPATRIAILVRSNHLIPLIANYFMELMPEVPIVSDEAFRLDASPAVQTIVQAIRYLTDENDYIAKAYLADTCTQHPYIDALDNMLPVEFLRQRDELKCLPLYELTERLFALFNLQEMEGQSAYLCAFYDSVATFVNEQTTDLNRFLREWDENICSQTIQSPEINGIRIISIHKSKGLEFPYVFVPFCDWKMEHNDILWCRPNEEPFNQLPIVPVDYSQKGMKGTIYQDNYEEEHQQNVVDNMNLLYVAFTRASNALYVIGKRGAKSSRSGLIEQTLPEILDTLGNATLEGEEDVKAPLVFEYGDMAATLAITERKREQTQEANVFLRQSKPIPLSLQVFSQKVEFKQSNDSRRFALPDDDEQQQQDNYIQMGSILHNVFSTIRTTSDIDQALRRMELDGILYDQKLTHERIKQMIRKRIEHPQVADWYNKKWTLFNECTILSVDPHTGQTCERRPDRVMTDGQQTIVVDFKFGRPRLDYHEQVRQYMQLLSSMGYRNVCGYLWYVYSNQIEEVHLKESEQ